MKKLLGLVTLVLLALGLAGCGLPFLKQPVKYRLTISVDGPGSVAPASGLEYDEGAKVSLTPTPKLGWRFDHWGGVDGASVKQNTIVMDGHKSISAVFASPISAQLISAPSPDQSAMNYNVEATSADGSPLTYDWDFGDGVTRRGGPAETHSFTKGGSFATKVTVSDNQGRSVTQVVNIKVWGLVRSSFKTRGQAKNIAVQAGYAYVADGSAGLTIVDVSNAPNPSIVGNVDTPGDAVDVSVEGNYAYVADGSSGIQIIDITDRTKPIIVKAIQAGGNEEHVYVTGTYLYAIASSRGSKEIQAYDIVNPLNPVRLAASRSVQDPRNIVAFDRVAFVSDRNAGLVIRDFSGSFEQPTRSNYTPSGSTYGVAVGNGTRAYLAGDAGLSIIDVTNRFTPALMGSVAAATGSNVMLNGDYAYVSSASKLHIVDVFDAKNPKILSSIDLGSGGGKIGISGEYAFLATGRGDLTAVFVSSRFNSGTFNHCGAVVSPTA